MCVSIQTYADMFARMSTERRDAPSNVKPETPIDAYTRMYVHIYRHTYLHTHVHTYKLCIH